MNALLIKHLSRFSVAEILNPLGRQQTVVVDFSSPNVAKPFHLGHFRATTIGNFIVNINEAAGHRVIGINYLGDFGSQFDILAHGFAKYGCEEGLQSDPLRYLNRIYVRTYSECVSSTGSRRVRLGAGETLPAFTGLSPEKTEELRLIIKRLTRENLMRTYARMNVRFTAYEYESDYNEAAREVAHQLVEKQIAVRVPTGAICIPPETFSPKSSRVVLLRDDGTSLYLSRDLAAAVSRYERYQFDRIHYVVEDSQWIHFRNLRILLERMQYPWAKSKTTNADDSEDTRKLWHVRFGHVYGYSSRRGEGVLLEDILDNAKQAMRQRMLLATTSHEFASDEIADSVADHLGVTCLVFEMLRYARNKPILLTSFLGFPLSEQNHPLDETDARFDLVGVGLQYTHARLCSLERNVLAEMSHDDPQSLVEHLICKLEQHTVPPTDVASNPIFQDLVMHLDQFPHVLERSYANYEPNQLVHYSLRLGALVNTAWSLLPVLRCDKKGEQLWRLSLFIASRNTLALCLRLLGLHPLSQL